jgi:hypothetical protein
MVFLSREKQKGVVLKEPTVIQKKVLKFIAAQREKKNAPPTLEEIRDHFGWRAIGTVQAIRISFRRRKRGSGFRSGKCGNGLSGKPD